MDERIVVFSRESLSFQGPIVAVVRGILKNPDLGHRLQITHGCGDRVHSLDASLH